MAEQHNRQLPAALGDEFDETLQCDERLGVPPRWLSPELEKALRGPQIGRRDALRQCSPHLKRPHRRMAAADRTMRRRGQHQCLRPFARPRIAGARQRPRLWAQVIQQTDRRNNREIVE
jgi:hypothetical protein